jgi:transcriptional regulator with XRE-family HTH domain
MAAMPESPEDQFRLRMRDARERAGMTQAQLTAQLAQGGIDIDPSGVARIERGERSPRLNEASAIAAILGIPVVRPPGDSSPRPRTQGEITLEVRGLNLELDKIDQQLVELQLTESRARSTMASLRSRRAQILTRLANLGALQDRGPVL